MPSVVKRNKQKAAKKASSVKEVTKFVSDSLVRGKSKKGIQKKTPKHRRRGVVYIKHLPHGFFEEQLRGYFSQFGAITRLRLARSSKTLGSKGYAFIEFRYPEVAEIAADAMNNYLMFKNIIKTVYIPPHQIKYDYFRSGVKKIKKDGGKMLTSKSIEARDAVVLNTNKLMTDDDYVQRASSITSKIQKKKAKLAALGIDYDIDGIAKNMGEEFVKPLEQAKPLTINDLKPDDLDGDADETFNPESCDIDSGDDFEDFEYDSEHSDDDDGIDVNIDNEKLENAIRVAQAASKTAEIDPVTEVGKRGKRKATAEPEVTENKAKPAKKGKENKTVAVNPEPAVTKKADKKGKKVEKTPEVVLESSPAVEKPSKKKKGKKVAAAVAIEEPVEEEIIAPAPTKKSKAAKKPAVEVVTEKPVLTKSKRSAAKKEVVIESPPEKSPEVVKKPAKQPKGKKTPATEEAPAIVETAPEPTTKGKGKKAAKVTKPAVAIEAVVEMKETRKAKKTVAPPQESPVPAKTKKLAKASAVIEKKKPVKADKKTSLKLAAKSVTSAEATDIVKVVKGSEMKGKKKAGGRK